ncbi:serine protease [Pseudonocardia sp. C8]|uniref:trypsin-like peptidase domain-containing protein n=1 Tax=Pseudonocardia sp. C8 TaxID=2762759 RepID=UPI0016435411|nr:trypsin-like peptidase domain-containing protein [Pseudonocardia sp. C8]MBC3193702.1 serine protease [Pseudonocardia sp. C8]
MSPQPRRAVLRSAVRRIAGIAAVAGLAVAAAVTVPVAASAAPAPAAIGPGVRIATPVAGGAEVCTANFLYTPVAGQDGHRDGHGAGAPSAPTGKLYLGTAAHCTAAAEAMSSVDGCTEPVQPEGIEVRITGRDGRTYTGRVAYNSWTVMQERGETDPHLCLANDLALIELSPEAAAVADPTVPGFGGPTALDTDGTVHGERVYSHQPDQAPSPNEPATPNKQGVSFGRPEGPRTHVVATVPPGVPGDSGAGYLDAEGRAFGLLSSLMVPTTTNGVTDLAQALAYAAEHGSVGALDLVPGTRPFAPTGPLTELPPGPAALLPDLTPVPLR